MTGLTPEVMVKRVGGLRANSLAAVVMLLIQYCLGISVTLYSALPASDHGKSLFSAFEAAVGDGPVLLTLHALLGTPSESSRPGPGDAPRHALDP